MKPRKRAGAGLAGRGPRREWGRAWSVGDGRTLHLRTGLQNIGNLRLADKSPSFGYAEQGRRLFVNARLDF